MDALELIIEGTPKNQMHDMVIFRAGGVFLGLLGVMDYPSVKSMEVCDNRSNWHGVPIRTRGTASCPAHR